MYKIIEKKILNPTVSLMRVEAPYVAIKAEAGQFIILRSHDDAERIPLTIAEYDRVGGTVVIIYQIIGAATKRLDALQEGDYICDFAGPLGRATETEGLKKVAVVGGGVGCAIAYPIIKKLYEQGVEIHGITGFRNSDLVIMKDEFEKVCNRFFLMTDDGSAGEKGLVTEILRKLIENGEAYDRVIAIGPLPMMKFVSLLTKEFGIKTVVSMNPIMIDGTGMCGGCRLTVGGKTKFACVDGPEFDGHEVNFDEAMKRSAVYRDFEKAGYEKECKLMGGASNG